MNIREQGFQRQPRLADRALHLAPFVHDKRVIHADAGDHVRARRLELLVV